MKNKTAENLTTRTARALKWNYIGMMVKIVLSFGVNTLMARILGPKPFGELAVATLVFSFGNLLANIGLASALIQKRDLHEDDIRFCFTCQMLVAAVLMLGLMGTAPLWARFFHEANLTVLLQVVSVLFVLQAFGTTSTALLNREQDVQAIQLNTIISYSIGYVAIGLPLALLHYGVWSLVAAWISQAFINSALCYLRSPHAIRPLFGLERLSLLVFGSRVLAANICNWGISNLDNGVVGRVAGPMPLAYYSRAFNIANMADNVTSGLLQVLLPAFSKVQQNTEKLRAAYSSIFGLLLLVLLPGVAAVSAVADVVVVGLYGWKWAPAIGYVRPIALAMAINAVMAVSGPLLAARGRPDKEFKRQMIAVVIAFAAYVISVKISVLALSWTVLFVYFVRLALLVDAVHSEIGSTWLDLLQCSYPAFILGAVSAVTAIALKHLFLFSKYFVRLVSIFSVDMLICTLLVLAFGSFFVSPSLSRSPQLFTLIPNKLRRFIKIPSTEDLLLNNRA